MTTSTSVAGSITALVRHLEELATRDDRAALAALRRGLGKPPGTVAAMAPYVEPFFDGAPDEAYIIASLFGLYPHHQRLEHETSERIPRRGLGTDLRPLRWREDGDEDLGVIRRFTALLDCDQDALPEHLRHLITLLKARRADRPIDYIQLFWDLRDWDSPDRRVQKRWASGFWSRDQQAAGPADEPGAESPEHPSAPTGE